MAKIIQIMSQVPNIVDEIYEQYREADKFRDIEYNAAVKIQSWYRGLRLRSYFKHLNQAATLIQKNWRGFLDRRDYRVILEESVRNMKLDYYNKKAIIIQKFWRGFYSRKYIFDYYKRKAYLTGIQQKNELILKELNEYKEYMERTMEEKKLAEKYRKLEEEAKRNHYLISTKMIPGVYNSPFYPTPNEKEYLMRTVKLDPPKKPELYLKSYVKSKFDTIKLPEGLPELPKKPQGPFRDPIDVRKQRYRPFSPSLKVETDYESLEKARQELKNKEWTERLHDEIFYPVNKSMKNKPYERFLTTQTQFGSIEYGTKFFREELKDYELPNGRFKSLVPAIPEFSKLNKTYVDPHYYMS